MTLCPSETKAANIRFLSRGLFSFASPRASHLWFYLAVLRLCQPLRFRLSSMVWFSWFKSLKSVLLGLTSAKYGRLCAVLRVTANASCLKFLASSLARPSVSETKTVDPLKMSPLVHIRTGPCLTTQPHESLLDLEIARTLAKAMTLPVGRWSRTFGPVLINRVTTCHDHRTVRTRRFGPSAAMARCRYQACGTTCIPSSRWA